MATAMSSNAAVTDAEAVKGGGSPSCPQEAPPLPPHLHHAVHRALSDLQASRLLYPQRCAAAEAVGGSERAEAESRVMAALGGGFDYAAARRELEQAKQAAKQLLPGRGGTAASGASAAAPPPAAAATARNPVTNDPSEELWNSFEAFSSALASEVDQRIASARLHPPAATPAASQGRRRQEQRQEAQPATAGPAPTNRPDRQPLGSLQQAGASRRAPHAAPTSQERKRDRSPQPTGQPTVGEAATAAARDRREQRPQTTAAPAPAAAAAGSPASKRQRPHVAFGTRCDARRHANARGGRPVRLEAPTAPTPPALPPMQPDSGSGAGRAGTGAVPSGGGGGGPLGAAADRPDLLRQLAAAFAGCQGGAVSDGSEAQLVKSNAAPPGLGAGLGNSSSGGDMAAGAAAVGGGPGQLQRMLKELAAALQGLTPPPACEPDAAAAAGTIGTASAASAGAVKDAGSPGGRSSLRAALEQHGLDTSAMQDAGSLLQAVLDRMDDVAARANSFEAEATADIPTAGSSAASISVANTSAAQSGSLEALEELLGGAVSWEGQGALQAPAPGPARRAGDQQPSNGGSRVRQQLAGARLPPQAQAQAHMSTAGQQQQLSLEAAPAAGVPANDLASKAPHSAGSAGGTRSEAALLCRQFSPLLDGGSTQLEQLRRELAAAQRAEAAVERIGVAALEAAVGAAEAGAALFGGRAGQAVEQSTPGGEVCRQNKPAAAAAAAADCGSRSGGSGVTPPAVSRQQGTPGAAAARPQSPGAAAHSRQQCAEPALSDTAQQAKAGKCAEQGMPDSEPTAAQHACAQASPAMGWPAPWQLRPVAIAATGAPAESLRHAPWLPAAPPYAWPLALPSPEPAPPAVRASAEQRQELVQQAGRECKLAAGQEGQAERCFSVASNEQLPGSPASASGTPSGRSGGAPSRPGSGLAAGQVLAGSPEPWRQQHGVRADAQEEGRGCKEEAQEDEEGKEAEADGETDGEQQRLAYGLAGLSLQQDVQGWEAQEPEAGSWGAAAEEERGWPSADATAGQSFQEAEVDTAAEAPGNCSECFSSYAESAVAAGQDADEEEQGDLSGLPVLLAPVASPQAALPSPATAVAEVAAATPPAVPPPVHAPPTTQPVLPPRLQQRPYNPLRADGERAAAARQNEAAAGWRQLRQRADMLALWHEYATELGLGGEDLETAAAPDAAQADRLVHGQPTEQRQRQQQQRYTVSAEEEGSEQQAGLPPLPAAMPVGLAVPVAPQPSSGHRQRPLWLPAGRQEARHAAAVPPQMVTPPPPAPLDRECCSDFDSSTATPRSCVTACSEATSLGVGGRHKARALRYRLLRRQLAAAAGLEQSPLATEASGLSTPSSETSSSGGSSSSSDTSSTGGCPLVDVPEGAAADRVGRLVYSPAAYGPAADVEQEAAVLAARGVRPAELPATPRAVSLALAAAEGSGAHGGEHQPACNLADHLSDATPSSLASAAPDTGGSQRAGSLGSRGSMSMSLSTTSTCSTLQEVGAWQGSSICDGSVWVTRRGAAAGSAVGQGKVQQSSGGGRGVAALQKLKARMAVGRLSGTRVAGQPASQHAQL